MILSTAILLPLLVAVPAQSRVHKTDGGSVSGELVSASFETVVLEVGGNPREFAAGEVLDLVPGPSSSLMNKAEGFLQALDYQNAANTFEAAAGESGAFWIGPWCSLRHAETLLAWSIADPGRAGDSAKAFSTWVETHGDSFWLPRAQMGQARAMARSGDVDGATSLMQTLSDTAFEKNLGQHVELEVNLVRCESFLIGGQAEVAQARLRDLVSKLGNGAKDPNTPNGSRRLLAELHAKAQVMLGDALEAKDGLRGAASYWEGLSNDRNSTADVRAAAWIGLARYAREQGQAREAQLQLAKVVATLPASDDVMARALFELGEIAEELGNSPTAADPYRQRLLERYPSTSWAAKLR